MFGYVKPVRCKLDAESWEQYRAAYCGLCHTLGSRYGILARFIVNYDFTYLAMLLFALQSEHPCPKTTARRCIASPFRKKCVCVSHAAFDLAADASVVLFWWKLRDAVSDKNDFSKIPYKVLCTLYRKAYRRAEKRLPEFAECVKSCILELSKLENERVASIDRPADTFARILAGLSKFVPDSAQPYVEQMLYNIGRFIYLVDAWDDLDEDVRHHRYNPIMARFSLEDRSVPQSVRIELEQTLCQSISEAEAAFANLTCKPLRPLLENIINPGLYSVLHQVASGEKPKKEKRFYERSVSGVGRIAKRRR